jgi:hypothetical protein
MFWVKAYHPLKFNTPKDKELRYTIFCLISSEQKINLTLIQK